MAFEALIITGTSCSGKTTLSKEICETNNNIPFKNVNAVTTRNKRSDDTNYEYLSNEQYEQLIAVDAFLVRSEYRGEKYGIKKSDYAQILETKNIPILVLTPESANKLISKNKEQYLSIFVDCDNELLWERTIKRKCGYNKKDFFSQCELDRIYKNYFNYTIDNINSSLSASLISFLWSNQQNGGGLPHDIIEKMIKCGMLLKDSDPSMVKGASYDLRLGDEYYYGGKIRYLSPKDPILTIEPYDYAIVSCVEKACIPRDIIAKFGLSVSLFCQGIILSNGPQVDPGFHGTLFCLLFNTSNKTVYLKRGQHYATIEFNKLIGFADPYSGKYQKKESIIDYIPSNSLHGAINELKKEVEELKKESKIMQNIYLGVAALMFAIISILLI